MEKEISREGVHTISDKEGRLIAILRRDPISRKHLVYITTEATATDIAEQLIGSSIKIPNEQNQTQEED